MTAADRYLLAACAEPSAPSPQYPPFTALVEQQADGRFIALVVNTQGIPISVGHRRWTSSRMAYDDAADARRRLILKHKILGEPQ